MVLNVISRRGRGQDRGKDREFRVSLQFLFFFLFWKRYRRGLFYSSAFNNPFLSVARSTKVFQHEGNFHRDILVDEMAVTN